ncbi:MAG: hypothetical protein QOE79_109 [Sphingomonadales bacterium]|jgi:hypothetical protein|nr:hypothetical protein [Sphingomonadales bacterium]
MVKDRIVGVLKGATEVNLRYSAIALNLARQYVKEFDGVVRGGATATDAGGEAPPDKAKRRPPIFLVGEAGTEAGGAFVLNNTADAELTVRLVVQGEIEPVQVRIVPDSLVIAPRDSAVVQLRVPITDAMEVGRDYGGAVVAPSLASDPVEFVVRRLADPTPAAADPKSKASSGRSPR